MTDIDSHDELCAWCHEPAEDALGLGWALCVPCGELYGAQEPPDTEFCEKHHSWVRVVEHKRSFGFAGPIYVTILACGCSIVDASADVPEP
jgi:hypothetical protein